MDINQYQISEQKEINLADFNCKEVSDQEDQEYKDYLFKEVVPQFQDLHNKLFAQEEKGILVILQAIDAGGKDEIIEYIFSNLKPQGLKVESFSVPSEGEENHDYLWRMHRGIPSRGQMAIMNRSYYEEIIAPKIYDVLGERPLPEQLKEDHIWERRYRQLNDFERYLAENGFPVVKFFFHVSKDKQKERLLERMTTPEKNYEFSMSDLKDRQHWDEYQEVFEEMLSNTGSSYGPWYILPADNPWLSRLIATKALIKIMEEMDLEYPTFDQETQAEVDQTIDKLKNDEI